MSSYETYSPELTLTVTNRTKSSLKKGKENQINSPSKINSDHVFYTKQELEKKNKWRKSEHALSLPMFGVLNNRQTATELFPHFGDKHGKFLNYSAIKSLKLLEGAHFNPSLSRIVMKHYINEKKQFHSIKQFAVYKLNELDIATSGGTKIPNAVRASIVCDLFESLMNSAEYSSPIIDRLKLELFRCIYGENQEFVNQSTIHSQGKQLPPKLIVPTKTFFELKPFFMQLDLLVSTHQTQQRQLTRVSQQLQSVSNTKEARINHKTALLNSQAAIKTGQILSTGTDASGNNNELLGLTKTEILQGHFFAWKQLIARGNEKKNSLKKKLRASIKKHNTKSRRMNFLAWKDYIWRAKISFYEANEFKLKRKLDESNKAAMVLLKKTGVAEQQIARIRQIRNASDMDQQQMLEKKMLQVELNFLVEKLQHSRRQLVQLQSDESLVYSPLLLTQEEQRQHIKLDSLLSEQIVLRWISYHLHTIAQSNKLFDKPLPRRVTNFSSDMSDCSVLFLIMHKLRGQINNIDFNKILLCSNQMKRKYTVLLALKEMKQFMDFDGIMTYQDLWQNRSDVIYIFFTNLMQNYPLLSLENNTHVKNIFADIDMTLVKLHNNLSNDITSLRSLVIEGETILNKSKLFIESIQKYHQMWLNAVNKCQKKALKCLSMRRMGVSMYIQSEMEAIQLQKHPNCLKYFQYLKIRSIIRKNNHSFIEDVTPMTPHLNISETDGHDAGVPNNYIYDICNEYSIAEINKILGLSLMRNKVAKTEHKRLIEDILIIKECENVIQEYFHWIDQCFRFYAMNDMSAASLSYDEIKVMLRDLKLSDNSSNMNDKMVNKLFKLSDMPLKLFITKFPIVNENDTNNKKTTNNNETDTIDTSDKQNDSKNINRKNSKVIKTITSINEENSNIGINSNNDNEPAAKQILNQQNARSELTMFEFIEFLLRIANQKYNKNNAPLSEKLKLLISDYIARFSNSADVLRDQIQSKSVKILLKLTYDTHLRHIFIHYCNKNNKNNKNSKSNDKNGNSKSDSKKSGKNKNSTNSKLNLNKNEESLDFLDLEWDEDDIIKSMKLSFDSLCSMLDELQLLSSNFSRSTLKNVFKRAQFTNDKTLNKEASKNKKDLIDYDGFLECLVVLTMYKKPDPYIPLTTRIEEFLVQSIINPLFHKNKIPKGASMNHDSSLKPARR